MSPPAGADEAVREDTHPPIALAYGVRVSSPAGAGICICIGGAWGHAPSYVMRCAESLSHSVKVPGGSFSGFFRM
jgi:hypothetical protein